MRGHPIYPAHDGHAAVTARSFDGVKVFFATTAAHRAQLGERITAWLAARPQIRIVDIVVAQSSDDEFHCLSIVVFYQER